MEFFCLQSLLPNTLDEALHISGDPWSIQKGKVWSCGQEITVMVFNVAVFAEWTNLCLKKVFWVQKTWTVPIVFSASMYHGTKELIN